MKPNAWLIGVSFALVGLLCLAHRPFVRRAIHFAQPEPKPNAHPIPLCIAFYNVENLFDTLDNPKAQDEAFTPQGAMKWNSRRYWHKIRQIALQIKALTTQNKGAWPELIGLCEVENQNVLRDLIADSVLKTANYRFIHRPAHEPRGTEVALLYQSNAFVPRFVRSYPTAFNAKTRSMLYVRGLWHAMPIHLLISHWPSQRQGPHKSIKKHLTIAKRRCNWLQKVQKAFPNEITIWMGDFNENPSDKAIQYLTKKGFFNPMQTLEQQGRRSVFYNPKTRIFDQILISPHPLNGKLQWQKADIYGTESVPPKRTFLGTKYLAGASDHRPVYLVLELHH